MLNTGRARRISWTALVSFTLIAIMACGGASAVPASAPVLPSNEVTSPEPSANPPTIQLALASSDFGVGSNRLAFGLIDSVEGPLRGSEVEVLTFFLTDSGQEGPIETQKAIFREWPVSPRGVYTVELNFDRVGRWGIGAVVEGTEGTSRQASAPIQVKETTSTPAIGSAAPRSDSKTVEDVDGFDQLTTDVDPDPELYSMTIAEAIDEAQPLMVVFSTPAYCQTATCGPQLDVVKEIKDVYKGRINVIHIEVYDNPHEIQGDLSNAIVSPTLEEWGLLSEPWTFILDEGGLVQAKFEAFTTKQELEEALLNVLQ